MAAIQPVVALRHDPAGVAVQDPRPIELAEALGQALRSRAVFDPGENVIKKLAGAAECKSSLPMTGHGASLQGTPVSHREWQRQAQGCAALRRGQWP